ncbi:MAG TPA: hypothetical protein VGT79_09365 [Xanthomonadaceae bacterium]|nr:hypothetical protein [Xanthomonadaceae bacterium]
MNKHTLVIAVAVAIATVGVAQAAPMKNGPAQGQPTSNSAQLSPALRGALVAQIVRTWGPFVQQVQKANVGVWAKRMQTTFAAATDSNLQRAAGMKTFQGMMDALVGQNLTDAQVTNSLALQAVVLKSGARPALLGSTTADLVYTPLAPCRIADTRVVGGPISGGFSRGFKGATATDFTAQGGSSTTCGIPASPSALMLNVTVVNDPLGGYLTVFPFATTQPFASNLNYAVGAIVANEIAAKMTIGNATDDFSVYADGTTDVVIDVVGYFMAPEATPLDTTSASRFDTIPAGTQVSGLTLSCPTGYAITGGGCFTDDTGNVVITSDGIFSNQQYCSYHNYEASASNTGTWAQCARIPGR